MTINALSFAPIFGRRKALLLPVLFWASGLNAQTNDRYAQPAQAFTMSVPESVGFSTERLARIDTLLMGFVRDQKIPNAVTLVARHGKIVHHKAFGFSNLEKSTPAFTDDIYRIASQTKLITTVGLMMLYEEGKFLLDDPISQYIPAFKNPKVLVTFDEKDRTKYTTRPAKSEITIRHLLSHSAGIPYQHPLESLPEFTVPYLCSTDKVTIEEAVNKLAARPLMEDPGEKFVYGLNTDILGRLIEVLSGIPLDVYIRTRVTEPLGMNDTYYYLPNDKANRLVELYSKEKATDIFKPHSIELLRKFSVSGAKTYFAGGAGMVSTVMDYAKLCQMMVNGGQFNGRKMLSRHTIDMMMRNQIGANDVWDRKDKFGLGLQIFSGETRYGENVTPGATMWGGYYCSEYTIDPQEDLILLVFTNAQPLAAGGEFLKKFRVLVYAALD